MPYLLLIFHSMPPTPTLNVSAAEDITLKEMPATCSFNSLISVLKTNNTFF